MLGKVYNYTFDQLLEMPLTMMFIYYDWGVYDFTYEAYMKTIAMGA